MVRTVKVRLELDRDDYKRGLRDAANETRGFDGEVRAAGKDLSVMGVEVKSAGTKVEAMGRQVDSAAKQTTALGDEAEKARRKTTGLGDESDKTKTKIVTLASEITNTKTALAALGLEFQRTGQVNVTELDRLTRSLRELERAKAVVGKLIPGDGQKNKVGLLDFALDEFLVNSVKSAGKGINAAWDGIWKSIANNPVVSTAVIGGIIVGLPIIIATVGGAIASGVGLGLGGGVIALGISRAVSDSRVSAAWGHLADTAAASMDASSGRFVEPLIRAAGRFEDAWTADVAPGIDSAMDALAPKLDDLTDSAVEFAHNIAPGFDDAVAAAGPFIDILSEHLPEIGDAISSFLGHLNNAGPGAEMFFDDLLTLVDQTVRALGWLTEKGAATYELFSAFGFLLKGDLSNAAGAAKDGLKHLGTAADSGEASFGGFHNKTIDVNTALGLLDGSVHKAADGTISAGVNFAALSNTLNQTQINADTLAGKMTDKLMSSMLGMSHSTLGVQSALLSLKDTFDANGPAIDRHTGLVSMNTKAGISNRESVLSAIESNLRMYDAQIASGVGADVAAQKYGTNTEALKAQLRQAGLTEGQVHDLIGEYGNVPGKVNTAIAMQGLADAISGIENLLRQLNGLTYTRTVTINQVTRHIDVGPRPGEVGPYYAGLAKGGIRRAAVGLVIPPSDPGTVLTGEPQTGGEVLIPMRGINTSRAADLGRTALGGYGLDVVPRQAVAGARPMAGGGVTNITTVTIPVNAGMGTNGYVVGQQIADALRPFVENNGGNVQMAIVGRQVT